MEPGAPLGYSTPVPLSWSPGWGNVSAQRRNTMKRLLAVAAIAVLSLGLVRSQQQQPYRVVFDLTSRDTLDQKAVLRWLKEVGTSSPNAKMEVVMYARGFDLVMPERSQFINEVK